METALQFEIAAVVACECDVVEFSFDFVENALVLFLGVVPHPDRVSIEFLLKFRNDAIREISHHDHLPIRD
jgi:hypothetical protein